MAIALEADFRSIKTTQAPEPAERQPAKRGRGEDFATRLEEARTAEAGVDAGEEGRSDALPAVPSLPFPSADTEIAAPPEGAIADAEPVALPTVDILLESEIIVDREIVREEVKVQAGSAAPGTTAEAEAHLLKAAQPAATPEAPVPQAAIPMDAALAAPKTEVVAIPTETPPLQAAQTSETDRAQTASNPPTVMAPKAETAAVAAAVNVTPSPPTEGKKAPAAEDAQTIKAPANPDAFALARPQPEPASTLDAGPPEAFTASLTGAADKSAIVEAASLGTQTSGAPPLAAVAPSAPAPVVPAAPTVLAAPAHAILTASPAQIVDIVAQSAEDGQSDRVVIQLDPPELGRVSIDFKFDAQGLQHVTITSETPEAMRQLRQMHFELVQSLERHGIGSQNMTFQHQQQGTPQSPSPNPFARSGALSDSSISAAATLMASEHAPGVRTLPGGRLDIRL